ncbi:MAG: sigma-54-dependent transcriptional regulator [bacterium]
MTDKNKNLYLLSDALEIGEITILVLSDHEFRIRDARALLYLVQALAPVMSGVEVKTFLARYRFHYSLQEVWDCFDQAIGNNSKGECRPEDCMSCFNNLMIEKAKLKSVQSMPFTPTKAGPILVLGCPSYYLPYAEGGLFGKMLAESMYPNRFSFTDIKTSSDFWRGDLNDRLTGRVFHDKYGEKMQFGYGHIFIGTTNVFFPRRFICCAGNHSLGTMGAAFFLSDHVLQSSLNIKRLPEAGDPPIEILIKTTIHTPSGEPWVLDRSSIMPILCSSRYSHKSIQDREGFITWLLHEREQKREEWSKLYKRCNRMKDDSPNRVRITIMKDAFYSLGRENDISDKPDIVVGASWLSDLIIELKDAVEEHIKALSKRQEKASSQFYRPILITSESGTGKELIALLIKVLLEKKLNHEIPFIEHNCAAIPHTLIESVLFGHAEGAYTGAHEEKKGAFLAAENGIVFLDEIGDLLLELQAKLLRVVESQRVTPLGEEASQPYSAFLVAATNHNLEKEVKEGRFRGDLLNRFRVLHLPSLNERFADIPALLCHFLMKDSHFHEGVEITEGLLRVIIGTDYTGKNVRYLQDRCFFLSKKYSQSKNRIFSINDLNEPDMVPIMDYESEESLKTVLFQFTGMSELMVCLKALNIEIERLGREKISAHDARSLLSKVGILEVLRSVSESHPKYKLTSDNKLRVTISALYNQINKAGKEDWKTYFWETLKKAGLVNHKKEVAMLLDIDRSALSHKHK